MSGRVGASPSASPKLPAVLVVLLACVCAVIAGLLAYTANPIAIALACAAIIAPMLALQPKYGLWLLLLGGLLVAGVIPIWSDGQATRAVWALSAVSFFLLAMLLVQAAASPAVRRNTPFFVWILLAFMAYATVVTLLRWENAYQALSGFKRYFQAMGVMVAFAWLSWSSSEMAKLRRLVFVVALLQLPWAVYELLRLVPIREATRMMYPGMIPVDVVAGTFGANMTKGGANGEMAAFLVVVLGFMLSRVRHGVEGSRRLLWLAPWVALPLFLGDTKVVVLFIPLLFLTLYRRLLLSRPLVGLGGLVLGMALTVGAAMVYSAGVGRDLSPQVEHTLDYNLRDRGYGGLELNRTTVLSHWAKSQRLEDPVSPVLGNGLGSAHDGTAGNIARRYVGYGVGLTAASLLLWEQGVIGFGLVLAALVAAWRCAGRVASAANCNLVRADAEALQAALPVFAIFLFYRPGMFEGFPFQIALYGALGYLAWLARHSITGVGAR